MKNLQRSISQNLLKRESSRCPSTKSAQSTRSSRSTKSSKARRVREKELRELNRRYQQQCNGWLYVSYSCRLNRWRTLERAEQHCASIQLPPPSSQSQLEEYFLGNFHSFSLFLLFRSCLLLFFVFYLFIVGVFIVVPHSSFYLIVSVEQNFYVAGRTENTRLLFETFLVFAVNYLLWYPWSWLLFWEGKCAVYSLLTTNQMA